MKDGEDIWLTGRRQSKIRPAASGMLKSHSTRSLFLSLGEEHLDPEAEGGSSDPLEPLQTTELLKILVSLNISASTAPFLWLTTFLSHLHQNYSLLIGNLPHMTGILSWWVLVLETLMSPIHCCLSKLSHKALSCIPIPSYRELTQHSSSSFNKSNPCSCQSFKQLKVLLWGWGWVLQVFLFELWVFSVSAFPDTHTCPPAYSKHDLAPPLQKCCQAECK